MSHLSSPGLTAAAPESLLASIVESSEDAIISKSLTGVVTSWNLGARRMFGYEPHEMLGRPIALLIPPERASEELDILQRLQCGERVEHFETQRLRKDGQLVDISVTISPVRDVHGRVIGASKVARDISEQKRARQQLDTLLENMRLAERMKAEFIATLSHELRTPLNAIVGWLELLKGAPPSAEELAEGLAAIERNTRSQVQMIEDLLDMSRIETGRLTLDMQCLDVAAMAAAAISSIQPMVLAKNIRLTTAFDTADGLVKGDRSRLQQILWNLLTNAVKFTPRGGHIHVTVERRNSHVELAVRDNGAGIPEELMPLIFDRFRQADFSTTRRHGGLGLGLAIALHLTALHGGMLQARSAGKGMGSTFIISLPVTAPAADAETSADEQRNAAVDGGIEPANLENHRILIVDDETDSLTVLRRILQKYGAQVQAAGSIDEALSQFESFKPDLVLSDISMPGRDGYDFIREVRSMPGGQTVPMVALTALVRPEDRVRTLRAGFQMHLAKPVNPEELVAALRNLLRLTTA